MSAGGVFSVAARGTHMFRCFFFILCSAHLSLFMGLQPTHFYACLQIFAVQAWFAGVSVYTADSPAVLQLFLFGLMSACQALFLAVELPYRKFADNATKLLISLAQLAHTALMLAIQSGGTSSGFFIAVLVMFAVVMLLLLSRKKIKLPCGRVGAEQAPAPPAKYMPQSPEPEPKQLETDDAEAQEESVKPPLSPIVYPPPAEPSRRSRSSGFKQANVVIELQPSADVGVDVSALSSHRALQQEQEQEAQFDQQQEQQELEQQHEYEQEDEEEEPEPMAPSSPSGLPPPGKRGAFGLAYLPPPPKVKLPEPAAAAAVVDDEPMGEFVPAQPRLHQLGAALARKKVGASLHGAATAAVAAAAFTPARSGGGSMFAGFLERASVLLASASPLAGTGMAPAPGFVAPAASSPSSAPTALSRPTAAGAVSDSRYAFTSAHGSPVVRAAKSLAVGASHKALGSVAQKVVEAVEAVSTQSLSGAGKRMICGQTVLKQLVTLGGAKTAATAAAAGAAAEGALSPHSGSGSSGSPNLGAVGLFSAPLSGSLGAPSVFELGSPVSSSGAAVAGAGSSPVVAAGRVMGSLSRHGSGGSSSSASSRGSPRAPVKLKDINAQL